MNTLLSNLLEATVPFKYVDSGVIDLIMSYGELINFSDKEIILTQGKRSSGLYIIVEGETLVTVKLLGKGIIKLATLSYGQFFGEVSLLENTPCTATIKSMGNTLCFLLKKTSFDMFAIGFPKLRYQINKALVKNVIEREYTMVQQIKDISKVEPHKKSNLHIYKKTLSEKKFDSIINKKKIMLNYLKNQSFFSKLDAVEFDVFIQLANVIEVENKFTLINEDSPHLSCFYILKGAVSVGISTKHGYLKFAVLGPNKLICSTYFFEQPPELFIYKSIGETTLIEIENDVVEQIRKDYPFLWYKLHNVAAQFIVFLQAKLNTQIIRMEIEKH